MRRFERASFVLGLVLLCWFVFHIDPEQVARGLADLGGASDSIFVLQAVPLGFLTLSWQLVVPPGPQLPLTTMARILIAGEAVDAVSPVAVVGGELMRASLLSARIPAQSAVPSSHWPPRPSFAPSSSSFWRASRSLSPSFMRLPSATAFSCSRRSSPRSWAAFCSFADARRPEVGGASRGSLALAADDDVALSPRLANTVPGTMRALRERPGRFGLSVLTALMAWLMGAVEAFFILRFLRTPVPFGRAVGIEVLAVTIEGVLFFVPAKIGVQEGGKVLIFLAAGLSPAKGLAFGLARRIRELAWAAVGLDFWLTSSTGGIPSLRLVVSPRDSRKPSSRLARPGRARARRQLLQDLLLFVGRDDQEHPVRPGRKPGEVAIEKNTFEAST